jgi:putative ABC transport system permease protein
MNLFITVAGTTAASLMALGAIFGALNSMYTAVAARSREVATLRALGFGRWAVFVSVLIESALLGVAGGAIGAAIAWLAFNGYQASTLNFAGSFTQVSFAFAVTPGLFLTGILWSVTLGVLGGALPALRAARMPIVTGLREL